MMMTLGLFVFSLETAPYQEMQRQMAWRHTSTSRVGAAPASQFLGRDDETVTLSGVLLPEVTGGPESLDALERMADAGKAWPLIEGTGRNYGMFAITSMRETKTVFFRDGAARRIEFQIALKRIDERRTDMIGTVTDELRGLLQ